MKGIKHMLVNGYFFTWFFGVSLRKVMLTASNRLLDCRIIAFSHTLSTASMPQHSQGYLRPTILPDSIVIIHITNRTGQSHNIVVPNIRNLLSHP